MYVFECFSLSSLSRNNKPFCFDCQKRKEEKEHFICQREKESKYDKKKEKTKKEMQERKLQYYASDTFHLLQ